MDADDVAPVPLVSSGEPGASGDRLWAVVLAGGEGRRLRPLVRHVHGEARPKQYATLIGSRTILGRPLDRASLLVPHERTVVVTVRQHRRFLRGALAGRSATVLSQPTDRGTAAGILLPVEYIARRDPTATVVVLPSDHFVGVDHDFMTHVADAAAFVDVDPARIVLVGVEATDAETEYGWIEPGAVLSRVGGTTIHAVARFVEKPAAPVAQQLLTAGALWNTFVVVARASTLVDAVRQLLPQLYHRLAAAAPLLGTGWGGDDAPSRLCRAEVGELFEGRAPAVWAAARGVAAARRGLVRLGFAGARGPLAGTDWPPARVAEHVRGAAELNARRHARPARKQRALRHGSEADRQGVR